MASSRRELLTHTGAGLAAVAGWSFIGTAMRRSRRRQEPIRCRSLKGIDKDLQIINADLLEEQAKAALPEGVYVFIAHGNGDQWTLRENRRAFGDHVFTPHHMGGVVRTDIDTSVTLLGEKLPHPVIVSPMGSHGLVHPAAELATAEGVERSEMVSDVPDRR